MTPHERAPVLGGDSGQRSPGTFAVVVIRPRKGSEINKTIQDPLARYNAVMAPGDFFTVEPAK